MRRDRVTIIVVAFLAFGVQACSSGGDTCVGKCDQVTPFAIDYAAVNAEWPQNDPAETPEDLFSVNVKVGDQVITAPTHIFGDINVIPYDDGLDAMDARGNVAAFGDDIIATYFQPGEIGIAVKHHRPEFRNLDLNGMNGQGFKEHFKLQDTHIEVPVGVEIDGQPRVITLNNPQSYENGRFGTKDYPLFFLKLGYPDYLSEEQIAQFQDNIRTMTLGFNAVSDFPDDYNGGDPLAAYTPEKVLEHSAQMVRAISGDTDARTWFQDPANLVYCAELSYLGLSAGMIAPLNKETFEPIVGASVWAAFEDAVNKHNNGEITAFTELNDNDLAKHVKATIAPSALLPAPAYAPDGSTDDQKVAINPMTMADIVAAFLRTHLPRQQFGEALAPIQGAVLQAMFPGLLEAMAMDQLPDTDPRRMAVDALFAEIVTVVGTSYSDYAEFQAALEPYMEQARMMTGPRDDTGTGLFVPPSAYHLAAQGLNPGGLIEFEYVAHGLHYSFVYPDGQ